MVIAHNMMAMNAQRQFNIVGNSKKKSTEKLSSGYKINRAADDAAGLAISEKMRRQIRGLSQGTRNTMDGISLCQVADGALAEVDDMLHRITELSVKSANGTNSDADRDAIQQEIGQLIAEIDRIGNTTEFNERKIFTDEPEENVSIKIKGNKILAGGRIDVSALPVLPDGQFYEIATTEKVTLYSNIGTVNNIEFKGTVPGVDIEIDGFTLRTDRNVSLFDFTGANNKLEIKNYANLISDANNSTSAVIHVGSGTELTIEGKYYSSGDMETASALHGGFFKDSSAAFIGGNKNENGGTVRIHNIQSRFGDVNSYSQTGALIGGGENGDGGEITFFGGDAQLGYGGEGAFFGGGKGGNGGVFNFEGGTILDINNAPGNGPYTFATNPIGKGLGGSSDGIINYNVPPILPFQNSTSRLFLSGDVNPAYNPGESNPGDADDNIINKKNIWIQTGSEAGVGMFLEIDNMNANILGIRGLNVSTVEGASFAIDAVKGALENVNSIRSKIGAQQNRLEHTVKNNDNVVENTQAAESQIRDTDMAKEMVQNSMLEILSQAGISMMSQANQSNQGVLSLLQ